MSSSLPLLRKYVAELEQKDDDTPLSEVYSQARNDLEEDFQRIIDQIRSRGEVTTSENAAPTKNTAKELFCDGQKKNATEAEEPEPANIDVSKLKVKELRNELSKRGLRTDGRKLELQKRLTKALDDELAEKKRKMANKNKCDGTPENNMPVVGEAQSREADVSSEKQPMKISYENAPSQTADSSNPNVEPPATTTDDMHIDENPHVSDCDRCRASTNSMNAEMEPGPRHNISVEMCSPPQNDIHSSENEDSQQCIPSVENIDDNAHSSNSENEESQQCIRSVENIDDNAHSSNDLNEETEMKTENTDNDLDADTKMSSSPKPGSVAQLKRKPRLSSTITSSSQDSLIKKQKLDDDIVINSSQQQNEDVIESSVCTNELKTRKNENENSMQDIDETYDSSSVMKSNHVQENIEESKELVVPSEEIKQGPSMAKIYEKEPVQSSLNQELPKQEKIEESKKCALKLSTEVKQGPSMAKINEKGPVQSSLSNELLTQPKIAPITRACDLLSKVAVPSISKSISSGNSVSSNSSASSRAMQEKRNAFAAARKARLEEMRGKSKTVVSKTKTAASKFTSGPVTASSMKAYKTTVCEANAAKKTNNSNSASGYIPIANMSTHDKEIMRKKLAAQMREKAAEEARKNALRKAAETSTASSAPYKTSAKVVDLVQETSQQIKTIQNPSASSTVVASVSEEGKETSVQPANLVVDSSQQISSPMSTYEISDKEDSSSDEDSDEESDSDDGREKKKIPSWAQGKELRKALEKQFLEGLVDPETIFGEVQTCDLEEIFDKRKSRYTKRTSSANWTKDTATLAEKLVYKRQMGY